ncbi:hypothetical protein P168DRAFT_293586 [Aspergillus campestris IBT 28561]|uniref:DUF3835 domain-containing protein n=1 Tax=Aspergillus campestris (strain IBT 28561) TaxID=1392248 RepID=A0A2I1CRP7_ASPC2|nr:uncharacterized protein P168DRAFT_293586 [Aspergillus campestris IBT 28561]PKY00302.1 hypothetical protein P168DRAFT_293586 [Aspergillus campestris IBT 28561]
MELSDRSLNDLERQRQQLEGNISKLQESLYHWRTWEAEYDGLREEIGSLEDEATTDDFLQVGRDMGGTQVNEKEVKVILGDDKGVTRTRQQVVDLISRRIDYVRQNVSIMERRLRTAENELQTLDSIEQLPAEPTADFPMTEIFEELDEDGNVVSSKTSRPGSEANDLLDVLKKAGVKDIPSAPQSDTQVGRSQQVKSEPEASEELETEEKQTDILSPTHGVESTHENDTSAAPESTTSDDRDVPVTDVDESPEDAELRREMIRYSLDEVGAVVAELEMDEDGSDVTLDDDYDALAYDDDDDDDEEDEHGRTTGRVLDEDYHQQMRDLEAKLNARGMWNMGKNTGSLPEQVQTELEQPVAVKVEPAPVAETVKEKKPKKKVAFADDLDIAPAPKSPALEKKITPTKESTVPAVLDSVIERAKPAEKAPPTNNAPKKVSRFKNRSATAGNTAAMTESSRPVNPGPQPSSGASSTPPLFPAKPSEPKPFSQPIQGIDEEPPTRGPKGKIMADKLTEHEPSANAVAPEPDELDDQLHQREIASEFYRMRNRMIQQNGGFLEEPETVPIETEDAPKRVSKFKAARMS